MKCIIILGIVFLSGCSSLNFKGSKFYATSPFLPMVTNDKTYDETSTKLLTGNDSIWYIYTKRF